MCKFKNMKKKTTQIFIGCIYSYMIICQFFLFLLNHLQEYGRMLSIIQSKNIFSDDKLHFNIVLNMAYQKEVPPPKKSFNVSILLYINIYLL